MLKKGTIFYSLFKEKCPRCHVGNFFKYPRNFNPSKILALHEKCSHCELKYMIEPSFFYGAMYVNYAITVGLGVITFVASRFIFDAALLTSFAAVFIALLVSAPFNLRLARILWLNMFVSYEPKSEKSESDKS